MGIVKLWNTRVRLSHLMPDSWRVRGFTAALPPTSDRNNACEGDHPPTSSGTFSTPCDNLTVPLRPVRKGGAGPDTFIPWRALLSLAGEPVPADAKSESVWGRRYRRRVDALIAAGYLIPAPGGVAPAGDTVEIVRVVDGRGHGHVAGVRIRASARFCAAHADNVPTRLSAARLFDGSG